MNHRPHKGQELGPPPLRDQWLLHKLCSWGTRLQTSGRPLLCATKNSAAFGDILGPVPTQF